MKETENRQVLARKVRDKAAEIAFHRPHPDEVANSDEETLRNANNELSYIGNFSKGLPHNSLGEVDPKAYGALLSAVASGNPADFEKIPLAGTRKLTNPQAGLAFDLEGADSHALAIRPAPAFSSAEEAGEMAELYWMALLRDVHFSAFQSDPGVGEASKDLSNFSDFRGPKTGGKVTPATIFRGFTPGDLLGPYVSQFLLMGTSDAALNRTPSSGYIQYGVLSIDQRQRTVKAGVDYLTDFSTWLKVQNGLDTGEQNQFDTTPRFVRNMRDLANYVHFDALYEAYLNACLILLDLNVPLDPDNPYTHSATQIGFGTFGGPHILSLVTEVATRALKAVWYQKWFVHRRLRPEAFGGLLHNHKTGTAHYPINEELLQSTVLGQVSNKYGSYLLPIAFPEGCPTHPAYGAGHATVAGACVTILKAWFDESVVLGNPLVSNSDGTLLVPYSGPDANALTVGGELNKLAANIAIGRNAAGVHWRSDYSESVTLGEAIALSVLEEQKLTYNENFSFSLTKFDGTTITI